MGESGLAVAARLAVRPRLFKGHAIFGTDGLGFKEIVEINGEAGTGKSLLLLDLIKTAILPKCNGGCEAEVIYVDTDCQFNVFQLFSVLQTAIIQESNLSVGDLNSTLEEALERVHLFNCSDLDKLFFQFNYFKSFLLSKPNVGAIVIDNISAFYWPEVHSSKDFKRMDTYLNYILENLHRTLNSFNIGLIYTKPSYFHTKFVCQAECSSTLNMKNINRTITLNYTTRERRTVYTAQVQIPDERFNSKFIVLNDSTIRWMDTDPQEALETKN